MTLRWPTQRSAAMFSLVEQNVYYQKQRQKSPAAMQLVVISRSISNGVVAPPL